MTDEEKFQKTFDKLHASPDVLTEVLKMTAKEQVVPMKKKRFTPKAAAAIAAVVLCSWIWKCGICNGCWRHPENCAGVDSRRSDRCNI